MLADRSFGLGLAAPSQAMPRRQALLPPKGQTVLLFARFLVKRDGSLSGIVGPQIALGQSSFVCADCQLHFRNKFGLQGHLLSNKHARRSGASEAPVVKLSHELQPVHLAQAPVAIESGSQDDSLPEARHHFVDDHANSLLS